MKCDTGICEINDMPLGQITGVEFKMPKNSEFAKFLKEFVEIVKEERKCEDAPDIRDHMETCPYNAHFGCCNGNVCYIRHVEEETAIRTIIARLTDQYCRAWSDKYNRCLRLEPIHPEERRIGRDSTPVS